jgi:hypothetical protein
MAQTKQHLGNLIWRPGGIHPDGIDVPCAVMPCGQWRTPPPRRFACRNIPFCDFRPSDGDARRDRARPLMPAASAEAGAH